MTGNPGSGWAASDALSALLRAVRLSGGVQFCCVGAEGWQTDDRPSFAARGGAGTVPFHIVAAGACWLRLGAGTTMLAEGDVVMFPRGTGHALGVGRGGAPISPLADLGGRPRAGIPVLRYGDGAPAVRLLCGYLVCDALDFAPIRTGLPELIHVRTGDPREAWLAAAVGQIVREVDSPSAGGGTLLERMTEVLFVELLRRQIAVAGGVGTGWLAAVADPAIGRALTAIHEDPAAGWTIDRLAGVAGTSRSTLCERFQRLLGQPPMQYLRGWRLHLAARRIEEGVPIAEAAWGAGYGSEAAFGRAFAAAYGQTPAAWRAGRA